MTTQNPEPGQAGESEPATADPTPNEPAKAASSTAGGSRRTWLLIGAVVAVIALAAAVFGLTRPRPAASPVPAATPHEAVAGYLEALAKADAERALLYALNRPSDTALLTNAMLEASRAKAALSVVTVDQVAGAGTVTVPATVKFGDRQASMSFSVTSTDQGWRLQQVTSTIDPGGASAALDVTINGQPVPDTAHVEVFPGTYTFGEKSPALDFATPDVVVDAVGDDVRAGLQPTLTKRGLASVNDIAAASLSACLKKRETAPAGCPNLVTVEKDEKIDAKSIRWTLVGNPWKGATYTLDPADPTKVRGATALRLRFRCDLTTGGATYSVDQTNATDVKYELVLTDAKQPVTWQRA